MFYEFLKFPNVQEQVTSSFKTLKNVLKVSDLPCFRKFSKQVSSFRSPNVRMCRRYKGRLSVGSTQQWSAGILWSLRRSLLCKVKTSGYGLGPIFSLFVLWYLPDIMGRKRNKWRAFWKTEYLPEHMFCFLKWPLVGIPSPSSKVKKYAG